jgi:uncharacterized protein YhaN
MRLKCLDLTRYGKFTDHRLDFGERVEGQPDLHIVYGPNEAGKSTALAGFLDLLFGIETRSRFGFLHPYPVMRLGGTLELAGGERGFVRIKKPQGGLLDAREQPIAEAAILGDLGGIDRDAYRTMFSLDDATLEAGGESILSSKGDLGQLLFSASAGLADLGRRLVELKAEADTFYKYRARGGELSDLRNRLAELKSDRERIDTLASEYAQLVEARDRAASHYEEAMIGRTNIQMRMDEIGRCLGALPRLADLRALRQRIAPLIALLADLPEAPRGWGADVPRLQKDEIELRIRAEGLGNEIADLAARRDAIIVDEGALRLADRAERLADLRARHVTAEKDIPERRLQLREAEFAIATILNRLERAAEADPRRLVLPAAVTGDLRALIERRSGLDAALEAAAREVAEARRRLDEARAKLRAAGGEATPAPGRDGAMAALAAALALARAGDPTARRRLAVRARDSAASLLAQRLGQLLPWHGGIDELAGLAVPDAGTIAHWRASILAARTQRDRHADEVERLTTEAVRLTAERDAARAVTGIVTDDEAAGLRLSREQAWTLHRARLDAASADSFEAALRRDDIAMDRRLGQTAGVARLNQVERTLAITMAEGRRAADLGDAAAAALQAIQRQIEAAVPATTPAPIEGLSLPFLEAWLTHRDRALETHAQLRAAQDDLDAAEADAAALRDRLAWALRAIGWPFDATAEVASGSDLDALLVAGQAAIDRETGLRSLRAGVEERERDLGDRMQAAAAAASAEAAWSQAWAGACAACWLGEGGAVPTLATVRELLGALAELGPVLEKQASLVDRIAKMEKDQAVFRAETMALAADLCGNDSGKTDPRLAGATGDSLDQAHDVLDLAQAIGTRVQTARTACRDRASATEVLEAAQARQRVLREDLAVLDRRILEMTAFFGVPDLAEVAGKLAAIEKRAELETQAEAAARDILAALRLPDIAAAEAALDQADPAALATELIDLKARFDDQDQRGRDMFAAQAKAADQVEAVGGDGAVARIEEERRTLLLAIEDGALRYLRLRLGASAAEQALRAYRDRHRSAMMARASEAFATISRGAYTGLAAQPERDSEILIARAAGGASKQAAELSKGTRFQLYLALRVAGYHEFAAARAPVPFIADDIMETFDDFRAEEAFRLLGDMARAGQVIYLTHHAHLCDIARRTCPSVKIHRLDTASP